MNIGTTPRLQLDATGLYCTACAEPIKYNAVLYGDLAFHSYTELVAWKQQRKQNK